MVKTMTQTQEFDADNPERLKARIDALNAEVDRLTEEVFRLKNENTEYLSKDTANKKKKSD